MAGVREVTPALLAARWNACGKSDVLVFQGHSKQLGDVACFSNQYDQIDCPFEFELPPRVVTLDLSDAEWVTPCRSSEHAIMQCKAAAVGSRHAFDMVRTNSKPLRAKADCSHLQKLDPSLVCLVAFEAVFQKFAKSPGLRDVLLATGDRVIAEAKDPVWGNGLAKHSPDACNPSKWKGPNVLGWALMEVRTVLRRAQLDEFWSALAYYRRKDVATQHAVKHDDGFSTALAAAYESAMTKFDTLPAQFSRGATVDVVKQAIVSELERDDDFAAQLVSPDHVKQMRSFVRKKAGSAYHEWNRAHG